MIKMLLYVTAWAALISGLGLLSIWLFVGCGVGLWVYIVTTIIERVQTTTLFAEILAPALFCIKELFGELLSWC